MPLLTPAVGSKLIKAYQKEAAPDATLSCLLSTEDIKTLLKGKTAGVRLFLGRTTKGALTLVAKPEPKETKTKKAMAVNVAEAEVMVGTIDCPPICPRQQTPEAKQPKAVKKAAPKAEVKKAAPAKKAAPKKPAKK